MNEIQTLIKGQTSVANVKLMIRNNPNLGLVNINEYIKFGKILIICSQNNEWKQNYDGRMGRRMDNSNPVYAHFGAIKRTIVSHLFPSLNSLHAGKFFMFFLVVC